MTSFAANVAPLFRPRDQMCMGRMGVDLISYAYMSAPAGDATFADHANARHVLARVNGSELPRMPLGGPDWSAAQIVILQSWIHDGFQP